MALAYFPGCFKVTFNSKDLGATQNGVEIHETVLWSPINVDHEGGTEINAIYAGKRVTLSVIMMQYDKETIEALFVEGDDGNTTRGKIGPIGQLAVDGDNSLAKTLVLNEIIASTRANKEKGVQITANRAVLEGDTALLLSTTAPSRLTLTFKLLPDDTQDNERVYYKEEENPAE